MTILKTLSASPSRPVPRPLIAAVLALASVGFVNALYLAVKKFSGATINCYIFSGCDTVNASPYSVVFGLPLSLYGAIFYLLVILFAVAYLLYQKPDAFRVLFVLATLGFLLSIYFTFLQGFVIKAFCFYCVVSAVVSTLNFLIIIFGWKKYFSVPPSASLPM